MSETFQQRLSGFEAAPPEKVWEAIAAALDNEPASFADKLRSFEAAPPRRAWDAIESSLNKSANTPVVPLTRSFRPYLRYAAMAAAIFAAVIVFNLFSQKAESDSVAIVPTTTTVHPDTPVTVAADPQKTTARPDASRRVETRATPTPVTASAKQPNRYMTVANTAGQTVRLSRKVYPVIDCARKTEASTWSRCKENIQALQARMATTVGGAAGDFGGLMDMIKSLEENQQP
jgi:hypothetical protein